MRGSSGGAVTGNRGLGQPESSVGPGARSLGHRAALSPGLGAWGGALTGGRSVGQAQLRTPQLRRGEGSVHVRAIAANSCSARCAKARYLTSTHAKRAPWDELGDPMAAVYADSASPMARAARPARAAAVRPGTRPDGRAQWHPRVATHIHQRAGSDSLHRVHRARPAHSLLLGMHWWSRWQRWRAWPALRELPLVAQAVGQADGSNGIPSDDPGPARSAQRSAASYPQRAASGPGRLTD